MGEGEDGRARVLAGGVLVGTAGEGVDVDGGAGDLEAANGFEFCGVFVSGLLSLFDVWLSGGGRWICDVRYGL